MLFNSISYMLKIIALLFKIIFTNYYACTNKTFTVYSKLLFTEKLKHVCNKYIVIYRVMSDAVLCFTLDCIIE